ncbi:glucosamine inositolphosphorylceramide transferase family protein [Thermophagus sp. OGC60D27]|uniref:glucosamine inositolphosphorylceramide transferase family protein n=1 Tax=Thermophagus sp. OGC60D27 TaxID=3458415 RepID=UPI004037B444
MKHQLIVIFEHKWVARWVANMLIEYSKDNNVEVKVLIKNRRKKGSFFPFMFFPKSIKKVFEPVDLTTLFPVVSEINGTPFVAMDSQKHQNSILEITKDTNGVSVQRGNKIIASGISGLWFFWLYFLAQARPLVLNELGREKCYQAFFQVRSYTLGKNTGFLRHNLERVFDYLIYGQPHRLCLAQLSDIEGGAFLKVLKFPFWDFFQKFRENYLVPRWRLIIMTVESLKLMKRVRGEVISPPKGVEWADPMLVDAGDNLYLFIEEEVNEKGHISVTTLDRNTLKPLENPSVVLNLSTHLSYPFVFSEKGQWYMIPENSEGNNLTIYRALHFPDVWEPFRTVFENEKWVDTTPFYHNNKWWIFSVKKPKAYASSYQDLYLFYTDDIIQGKWVAHPQNPVVSDIRHARPAGPLFNFNGKLYRPTQNCLHKYGGGMKLCRVDILSEYEYSESVEGEFLFPWYSKLSSFHTVAVNNDRLMGDCYY